MDHGPWMALGRHQAVAPVPGVRVIELRVFGCLGACLSCFSSSSLPRHQAVPLLRTITVL